MKLSAVCHTPSFEISLSHPADKSSAAAIDLMRLSAAERCEKHVGKVQEMPETWTWREYKSYPRFAINAIDIGIYDRSSRNTTREFSSRSIDRPTIDKVISKTMLEQTRHGSRGYPSAGARYSVESYLCAIRISGLDPGVYYIDKVNASYVPLFNETAARDILTYSVDAADSNAALLLVHTAVISRSMIKYGGRGLRFSLIEAGAVSMRLELEFANFAISSFWIGGFDDEVVSENLGVHTPLEMEYPVLVQAFGYTG